VRPNPRSREGTQEKHLVDNKENRYPRLHAGHVIPHAVLKNEQCSEFLPELEDTENLMARDKNGFTLGALDPAEFKSSCRSH
jgi:hypothetical protein